MELSDSAKNVLMLAADEAERARDKYITHAHLLSAIALVTRRDLTGTAYPKVPSSFRKIEEIEGLRGYATPKVECQYVQMCLSYSERCQDCEHNRVRSYFTPKTGGNREQGGSK